MAGPWFVCLQRTTSGGELAGLCIMCVFVCDISSLLYLAAKHCFQCTVKSVSLGNMKFESL